jgi:maltooligosyltrehalose trehalohydrolase
LHAQWDDDVHHALHVLLTGETQGYYADFAEPGALAKVLSSVFLHDGSYSSFRQRTHGRPVDRSMTPGWRFVVSLQTHDQVGNRATGDRLSDSLTPGTMACGAALLLTSAYTPMLFMGEEWAAATPWQYFTDHTDPELADAIREGRRGEFAEHGWDAADVPDPQARSTPRRSTLDWSEPGRDGHARMLAWYRDLLRLRRSRPDLRDPRLDQVVVHQDGDTVLVERGEHRVAVNLSDDPVPVDLHGEDMTVLLAWRIGVEVSDGKAVLPGCTAAILGPA